MVKSVVYKVWILLWVIHNGHEGGAGGFSIDIKVQKWMA